MKIRDFDIPGLKLIELRFFQDERGYFTERFNASSFEKAGLPTAFFQDNHSRSKPRVLRGLHFQYDPPQGKLVSCVRGRIWDVAVDIRMDSPTFGQTAGIELSEGNGLMLWLPAGFAHGFCVLGEQDADVIYKVDAPYNGSGEGCLNWNDPTLDIRWPIKNPILSTKDQVGGSLRDYQNSKIAELQFWSAQI